MFKIYLSFIITFLLGVNLTSAKETEARLLRFPAISGNQIVFTYAGDLYSVPSDGGTARKLTNDIGFEMFAKFSPDGSQLAFTGQYDGNTEVFVMPAEGGSPRRLTYTATLSRDLVSDRMGPNNIVMSWTPDGKNIIYRSRKQSFNAFKGQLFQVPADGGLSTELPLSEGGFCSFSSDGKQLAFNRVFREFRTWKYYKGGMADDIWMFDFNSKQVKQLTHNDAQDLFPMWAGEEIFFLSDRDRTMNLFVYNTKTEAVEKVTNFTEYDIKFPSIGDDYIVFENGGNIYKLNVKDKKPVKVPVFINNDFVYARNEWKDASKNITDGDVSPNGERVIFSARGELFNTPVNKGITYNLTQTSGVHERSAVWSPDGKYIAYLSDQSGEFEVYIQDQQGKEKPIQLTKGADTYKFSLEWSPDSKKLLWSDRKLRLRYVDIDSKKTTTVHQAEYGLIRAYNWSPDSKWISFSLTTDNQFSKIVLYHVADKKLHDVTDNWYDSGSPTFSTDGKYLLFVSDRDFNPTYSRTEWNHAYTKMSRIYMAILSKDTPSPFAPENDTVKIANEEASNGDKTDSQKDKEEDKAIQVDLDGISKRIVSLPIAASNYYNLACVDNKVYYYDYGSERNTKLFDLDKKKETTLGNFHYGLAANKKKMIVVQGKKWAVIDLPSSKVKLDETIDVSNLKAWVDYQAEWKQIYDESWRQMRDFFYVENMHGVDWQAMHDKYAKLVPYARHRDDLTYLIGELIGELNVGHAYVQSGDRPEPKRIKTGLLGAKISTDPSGYYQIEQILEGANWSNQLRSPLEEVGVHAKAGDYIIAVNGISTKTTTDLYSLLVDKADKEVELTINSQPSATGARNVIIKPIADEADLYYYNWVQNNIRKVSEATNGEIGYIHVPDMGANGLNHFSRLFYPQLNKKGLIIDDRGNGGGNVSPMLIERLQRVAQRANIRRNYKHPSPVPSQMVLGPKVLLIDRYSASDGDLFPYAFKHYKLGTVIGTRSWGGVVGISGSLPFIDGGQLNKPEFASYSADKSEWIIEGYGVDPDIVLDNDPHQEYLGKDAQLQKAIELIKQKVKTEYKPLPPVPRAPDKSK
ncbi:S41 family peptidase [Sunxiuqinia elliptica]|uniref:Tricorn protease homolog n=1 Tax=Sunxiuqinia elliptica TaxID=655355 RepID=A0A1I2K328_9BACT|nr:S41 family peptidase [Sunxiuqinia elliptica]SFF60590.1 tricorn protease [Sunxiuqinia elliptica]